MSTLPVTQARSAYARRDWRAVYEHLHPVREELDAEDLVVLAEAAWWLGDVSASRALAERAFEGLLAAGAVEKATDRAQRLALSWGVRGDVAAAMGWLHRAERLLRDLPRGVLHGRQRYLEVGFVLLQQGDTGGSGFDPLAVVTEIRDLAEQHDDATLACFALVVEGLAAISTGETARGFAALDEAMLPVLAGRVDALWAGDVYCTTIHVCDELADLARMREWTASLARWATPLSQTFMYAAVTRVHELQVASAEGDWDLVEEELGRHSESLVGAHGWLSGVGFYELGEVRRLRGDTDDARAAYDRARSFGIDPQPGAALLLRTEGRVGEALAQLRIAIADAPRLGRARLLLPAVELALEVGERAAAEAFASELAGTARFHGTPGLVARAAQASALLSLDAGRPADAVPQLQRAAAVYREQRYRYATAEVHEQLARAHRMLGDTGRADAELATARAIYERLGARPDVDRLSPRSLPGGLTAREAEVLTHVAAGASNRDVARALVISEKTVGRHLANIYTKIGVGSRTAAAAWAREHGL